MANVAIANTDAALAAKTLDLLESDQTFTGLKTFNRGAAAPFACASGSLVVTNLDADKLDGVDATVFARWDGTGTSLGQLAFPATQLPSSGANVLDDYEEQAWTPIDSSGASLTFTGVEGAYVKIGQLVIASCVLTYPATVDGSNTNIGGLPFAVGGATNIYGGCINATDEVTLFSINMSAGSTSVLLYTNLFARLLNSAMSGNKVSFTAIYRATA